MRAIMINVFVVASLFCATQAALGEQALMFQPVVSIYSDADGKGFLHPEDVACGAEEVIVADTGNDRLVLYSLDGNEVKFVSQVVASQLQSPIRVQRTSRGEIWALSSKTRRLLRFGADGQFLGNFEMKGAPDWAAVVPRSFRIDKEDRVYLLDIQGGRLLVSTLSGEFLRQIALPAEFGSFADFVVDSGGTLYLVDSVNACVHSAGKEATSFSPLSKSLKEQMKFPTYIATDNGGTLYLTDQNGGRIVLLGLDGSHRGQKAGKGWNEGLFDYPVGLCLSGNGLAFVADRNNNRVQIFR
ncbi:NHL repeat-containing protein [Thiovibrio sp. JS02]